VCDQISAIQIDRLNENETTMIAVP